MKVYLIPGLGFDHRIFERLELNKIDFEYLNWIDPKKNETIKDYAIRFSDRIDDKLKEIVLVGHSLGGIIAQEIAAIKSVRKIILISCIKSRKELPLHFRIVKPLRIHKFFSKKLTAKTIKYWGKNHDYETPEEQELVVDMVSKQSNNYLRWALKQLSVWKKPEVDSGTKIFQINGGLDKTFPLKLIVQPNEIVKNGGHFMVYKHSKIISTLIVKEIASF
ncbi:MAG: lipase family alpha/beta hydrolase [Crocinitomicaceae bacterium]